MSRIAVVEAADACAAVEATSAFEAASVAASDEEFVVEHPSDLTVYIAVAVVSEHAAAAAAVAAAAVAPVEIEAEPERFAELNIVENSRSSSAGRAEDTAAVAAADTAAVFAVDIVFAVLVGVARPTFAVGLLVVAGPTEPVALVNYVVELVESTVIAVAEWAFEFVVIVSKLDFASVYLY